ncbi:MAG: hypothetical protein OXP09_12835 [Gammaproteobacteria bacterium]|nr:hypothetical protein [Gammaproteobacteria bacterium]
MADRILPSGFEDLESFARDWALATESERRRKRQSTDMEATRAFYDRMTERIGDILGYLNELDLQSLPVDAQNLLHMTLSLAEVGLAVEIYRQPAVTDGFPADRFRSRRLEN